MLSESLNADYLCEIPYIASLSHDKVGRNV